MVSAVDLMKKSLLSDTCEEMVKIPEKQFVPRNPIFFDDKGFVKTSIIPVQQKLPIDLQIPVDGWTFTHWRKFITDLYQSFFDTKFPMDLKTFNITFSDIRKIAFEEYFFTNEELKNMYFDIYQNTFPWMLENDVKFYAFVSIVKKRIPYYFVNNIEPMRERERFWDKNLRGVRIDQDTLFESLDDEVKNLDHLIRQMGIPVMQYFIWKRFKKTPQRTHEIIYETIKNRLKFELTSLKDETRFLEDVIKNSIYWGPYPFRNELSKSEIPDWKVFMNKSVDALNLRKKSWWLNGHPNRSSLKCLLQLKRELKKC